MAAEFKIVERQTGKEYELSGSQDRDFVISWIDIQDELIYSIAESLTSISVSYSMDMCPQISIQLFDPEFRMLKSNYFNIGQNILFKSSTPAIYEHFGTKAPSSPTGQLSDHPSDLAFIVDKIGKEKTKYIGWVTQVYEVASVSIAPGSGASPSITIEARTAAIQQMKRDKEPSSVKGEGHVYVSQAAAKYDLKSFVQQTSKSKQISKGGTDKQADSLWDVLNSLASSAKFSLFEANGVLFFASNQYIYGLWGPEHVQNAEVFNPTTNGFDYKPMNFWYVNWPAIPLDWVPTAQKEIFFDSYNATLPGVLPGSPRWLFDDDTGNVYTEIKYPQALIPLSMPTFRRSDNDIYQVEGSLSLDRTNGIFLRPGMTIYVDGIPTFNDYYLITDVSYSHMSTDPVQITFKKPEREAKYITQIPVGPIAGTNVVL
jgi:hypothetical protein